MGFMMSFAYRIAEDFGKAGGNSKPNTKTRRHKDTKKI